jgi:hypothetical protein
VIPRIVPLLALAGLALPASAATDTPIVSAEPVMARAAHPLRARLSGVAASRRVALVPPRASELAQLAPSPGDKRQPLAIGVARSVDDAIPLAELSWQSTAAGARVARVDIRSPGAAALRVALDTTGLPPGIGLRFAGTDGVAFDAQPARRGILWSPTLHGDVAAIEIEAPANVALGDAKLAVPRLSHIVVDGADLVAPAGPIARATGIGTAGSCNIDVACIAPTNPAAAELAKSVAKLSFVGEDGRTFLCTGTLLADTVRSNTPYFLTANHCITSAAVAQTINTYWFYDAATCNSKLAPPFIQLTGGGALLGRSPDYDWTVVRLNEAPPAGTMFAAWRAEPMATGTTVITIHHPSGDLAKYSKGQVTNDSTAIVDDLVHGSFSEIVWSEGVTEGGSSGGAIATVAPSGTFYEVRGGLYEGSSACGSLFSHLPDYYSHLAATLPVMRQYLTPNAANPNGVVVAVEFYNAALDHYFLSTNPDEIANLDSGRTVGWVRTGLRFLVYDHQAPGTSPVCRFYRTPRFGDSHFYSASPQECAQTAAEHPVDWTYESAAVFYVQLPDQASGACPAGTVAVYRFFNSRTTNHRYTVERVVRDEMAAVPAVWTAEGYGPGPSLPIMCAAAQ